MTTHTDPNRKPSRDGLEPHQVWAWMAGANPPRWEIRGTGAVFPQRPEGCRILCDYPLSGEHIAECPAGWSE